MTERIAGRTALLLILSMACGNHPSREGESPVAELQPRMRAPFADVSTEAGLDFVHQNGMTGAMDFVEMMGPGGAMIDYDGDGDLDVYLLQGKDLDENTLAAAGGRGGCEPGQKRDRLYRNDLHLDPHENPRIQLVDVTAESGIEACGYGMGVAAADVDNDGWVDLYVTNWGENQLWKNNGNGTFTNVTQSSRSGDRGWGASAAFFDFDRDGWLDLYVANYVDYHAGNEAPCFAPSSARDYCAPTAYPSQNDRLYHNLGDGTFEDISAASGVVSESRYGLGVATADFNRDGMLDLYVANDRQENFLWINQGDGTFLDHSLTSGCAVNRDGMAEASMGVDTADFDADGDEDLVLAHLGGETNTVYVNDGHGTFEDSTTALKIAGPSLPYTTFGIRWLDYDNDDRLDLFAANGAVIVIPELAANGDPYPLHQLNQLFRQDSDGFYKNVSRTAGPAFELSEVTRGVADGDMDNDGDIDLLLINNNGRARLLVNTVGQEHPWIGLRLIGVGGRDMLGAEAIVRLPNGRTALRRARTDGSYCSSRDPRILVGLGKSHGSVGVVVNWPDGTTEEWMNLESRRYWDLRQGHGSGPTITAEVAPE